MTIRRRQKLVASRRRRALPATGIVGFLVVCSLSALSFEQTSAATPGTPTTSGIFRGTTLVRSGSVSVRGDKFILSVRGGGTETTTIGSATGSAKAAKKKKKKKGAKKTERDSGKAKIAIDNAMKEKDVAEALGVAIR
jgi:hypothetical protein